MIFFLSYWVYPVVSSCMWFATILTLLVRWKVDGSPHYASMERGQHVAYISDVGAQGLKPLFITGCVITAVFFNMAFVSERWLRHSGRLARNKSRLDKICAILSIIFAMCGGLGLILLSIFDTLRHSHAHNGCLVLFMGGYLLSAIFVCAEYYRLGIHYKEHRVLVLSFWVKLAFIIVELSLAIAFGVTGRGQNRKNQAAVIEWVIAFIFTFYMLSFVMDLYPSIRSDRSTPQGQRLQDPSESDEGYPGEMRERSDSDLEWPLPLPRGATQ